jgi:hypothetical protein
MSRPYTVLNRPAVSGETSVPGAQSLPVTPWQTLVHLMSTRRDLLSVLDHRRSHIYLFSIYLPHHVVYRHTKSMEKAAETGETAAVLNSLPAASRRTYHARFAS